MLSQSATAIEKLDRGLIALRRADNTIFLSWRLLASDPKDVAFNVYETRQAGKVRDTQLVGTLRDSTCFITEWPRPRPEPYSPEAEPHYHVRPVIDDKEGPPSHSTIPFNRPPGSPYICNKFNGGYTAQKVAISDLDGDGDYEYIIKQPNFNTDPSEKPGYWKKSEDTYKIEAYSAGISKPLWRYDMGWAIEEGVWYSPYIVYDLDGDGKAEVYAKAGEGDPRDAEGRVTGGPEWLVQLDGMTGEVKRKVPWPDREGFEDYNNASRNMLAVAYLDGKRPHLIIERGTYRLIKIDAYDPDLKLAWRWNSEDEKKRFSGQGTHGIRIGDVDDDGRDEIVVGACVVDDNGRGMWTLNMGHPDVVYVGHIDPAHPGREILLGFEHIQKSKGVCLVDAKTGEFLWAYDGPTTHVHGEGMVGDIIADHPGQECYSGEKDGTQYWMYTAAGERIGREDIGGLNPHTVFWDDDPQKEIVRNNVINDFEGKKFQDIEGEVIATADCFGDWREEVITSLPGELRIYTTTIPAKTRRVCLMQDHQYRLDVATVSMGYFTPPQLSVPY